MVDVASVLAARRGHVSAPAGCGKTELIGQVLTAPTLKPTLVLTHTTAGVAALRQRLGRMGIPASKYRLNTIAGWALTVISMFPERAGYAQDPLLPPDYRRVQAAVAELCGSGDIGAELRATYGRLLVDEYQDCSVSQHAMISGIADAIPTVVFGDPMQAIFDFADPLPHWGNDVGTAFPELGQLSTPWRWNRVGAQALGTWLMTVRQTLEAGGKIDLRTCPGFVVWSPMPGDANLAVTQQVRIQYEIARRFPGENILIIGDSIRAEARHTYASRAHGVGVVERVDFPDVVAAATQMHGLSGALLLEACIRFLILVMTNVHGDKLKARVETIAAGRHRTPATPQETAAMALSSGGGYGQAIEFLKSMAADKDRRIYRYSAFNMMIEALSSATTGRTTIIEAVAALRERQRHAGRNVPAKAVGSTLLLKGLEAEHAVILDADRPNGAMSAKHLYVALTRGARSIHVFSRSPVLP
jgi:DNA helicase-2/ATP-dependent DNA helicase PcrA